MFQVSIVASCMIQAMTLSLLADSAKDDCPQSLRLTLQARPRTTIDSSFCNTPPPARADVKQVETACTNSWIVEPQLYACAEHFQGLAKSGHRRFAMRMILLNCLYDAVHNFRPVECRVDTFPH